MWLVLRACNHLYIVVLLSLNQLFQATMATCSHVHQQHSRATRKAQLNGTQRAHFPNFDNRTITPSHLETLNHVLSSLFTYVHSTHSFHSSRLELEFPRTQRRHSGLPRRFSCRTAPQRENQMSTHQHMHALSACRMCQYTLP